FEMLTGTRAFAGDDVSDVVASVLAREPEWARLRVDVSPALGTFIKRCLQKDPKQRVRDVGDVRLALEGAFETPVPATAAPAPAAHRHSLWLRAVPMVAAAVVAGAIVGAAAWMLRPPAPSSPVTRFPLALGEGQQFSTGANENLAISPDGTKLVYVANNQLY